MFIAFAPFNNPEIVVSVAIENVAKGGGATNAAPVARQIMDQYFGNRVIKYEPNKPKLKTKILPLSKQKVDSSLSNTSQETD